jgi:NAD(P)-dependent dehydrogenase (short-subunit alcohol dehydrogenase family)
MGIQAGRFTGRRAVVTGASAGIGRATALRFAAEGARVGLVARRREPLEALAAEIAEAGGEALVLRADSSVEPEIAAAMAEAAARWGGLDIVISNAGIELLGQDDRVDRLDRAIWDRLLTTNLTGQFLACKHARWQPAVGRSFAWARMSLISAWPPTNRPIARARAAFSR